jgi:hypothetical protein
MILLVYQEMSGGGDQVAFLENSRLKRGWELLHVACGLQKTFIESPLRWITIKNLLFILENIGKQ